MEESVAVTDTTSNGSKKRKSISQGDIITAAVAAASTSVAAEEDLLGAQKKRSCQVEMNENQEDLDLEEPKPTSTSAGGDNKLLPYPFFYYRDHSQEQKKPSRRQRVGNPWQSCPTGGSNNNKLLPPRQNSNSNTNHDNFVVKLHAILTRADIRDIIAWQSHGRAWKIWDTNEFEQRILGSSYFPSDPPLSLSAFWKYVHDVGFHKITKKQGSDDDRNCYYHPYFLRGLPHLCQHMSTPRTTTTVVDDDPRYEPDLAKISQLHPVPDEATAAGLDNGLVHLSCYLRGGRSTMSGGGSSSISDKRRSSLLWSSSFADASNNDDDDDDSRDCEKKKPASSTTTEPHHTTADWLPPDDLEAFGAFQKSLGASEYRHLTPPASPMNGPLSSSSFQPRNSNVLLPPFFTKIATRNNDRHRMLLTTTTAQQPTKIGDVDGDRDVNIACTSVLATANVLAFGAAPTH